MIDSQWHRLRDIVTEAVALPESEQEGFIRNRCASLNGSDQELLQEARKLLAIYRQAESDGGISSPFKGILDNAMEDVQSPFPEIIGPWRLLEKIGSGGMGVVYSATRRDESFEQSAALKLIRPGFASDFTDRFLRERALLAQLEHPSIARLLDGGLTSDGTPYLAMELVDGKPITEHAVERNMPTRERLELFLQVCDAVAFAHLNLVVHRDLKPANILVDTSIEPRVKLLDFGVAKLLSSEDGNLTQTGTGPLTPAYAAPEQLTREPITTATDVYALGITLYELLADERPYSLSNLTAAQIEEVVCRTPPRLPSVTASLPKTRRYLKGDVDQMILKALSKEPGRRYASADAFAQDIRRHLAGLPVTAQRDSAGYRIRKFVGRNRAAVIVALLVTLLTGFFTARLATERNRAQTAAITATEEAIRAESVAEFLEQILRTPNQRWYVQSENKGPETPIRLVLDEAAQRMEADFIDQPELRGDLHHVFGDTYLALGLADKAEYHHAKALEVRQQTYDVPHIKIVEALYYVSIMQHTARERLRFLADAIEMRNQLGENGNNFPFMLGELANLKFLAGRYSSAADDLARASSYVEEVFVDGHDGYIYRNPLLAGLSVRSAEVDLHLARRNQAESQLGRFDSLFATLSQNVATASLWYSAQCVRGWDKMLRWRLAEAEEFLQICSGERVPSELPSNTMDFAAIEQQSSGAADRLVQQAAWYQEKLYDVWQRQDLQARYASDAARLESVRDSISSEFRIFNRQQSEAVE